METHVRMGDAAASTTAGHVLACVGLGSCIAVALYDRRAGVAGLAHVMLPASPPTGVTQPGKYADLAVPELIAQMQQMGAAQPRLEAVIVGGAAMFSMGGSGAEIGGRNAAAVTAVLGELRIPLRYSDTGGSNGRTMRLEVGPAMTTFTRIAGGKETVVFGGIASLGAVAA